MSAPWPTTGGAARPGLGLTVAERLSFQRAALGEEGIRPARLRATVPVAVPAPLLPAPVAAVIVQGVTPSGPDCAVTVTLTITLTAPAVARFHLAPEPDPSASGAVPLVVDRTG